MHTTTTKGKFVFLHNSDYSGDVRIHDDRNGNVIIIPFNDLKEFMVGYVRKNMITAIEQATDDDLLFPTVTPPTSTS